MAQSVKRLTLLILAHLTVRDIKPHLRLSADSTEPAWDSLSLCPSWAHAFSLSLTLSNKLKSFSRKKSSPNSLQKTQATQYKDGQKALQRGGTRPAKRYVRGARGLAKPGPRPVVPQNTQQEQTGSLPGPQRQRSIWGEEEATFSTVQFAPLGK